MPFAIDLAAGSHGAWSSRHTLLRLDLGTRAGVKIRIRNVVLRAPTAAERRSIETRRRERRAKPRGFVRARGVAVVWGAGESPGSYRPDLFDAARAPELLAPLVAGLTPHVDLWLGETLGAIAEAEAVVDAIGNDPRPLWISYTLADQDIDPETPQLRSGEPVADAARAAARLGAVAVLFNCSQPEVMAPAIETARAALAEFEGAIRIGAYANTFPPKNESAQANDEYSELRADLDPSGYLDFAREWVARGAGIVGGCCGIGPDHIAALRAEFE
jgi:hypothetical protein